jgi:hypothetical protein
MFVHYQPSYCASKVHGGLLYRLTLADHFHVHVVHIEHEGLAGMTVGQAHLLDDLISLVRPVHYVGFQTTIDVPARAVSTCSRALPPSSYDLHLRPRCRTWLVCGFGGWSVAQARCGQERRAGWHLAIYTHKNV